MAKGAMTCKDINKHQIATHYTARCMIGPEQVQSTTTAYQQMTYQVHHDKGRYIAAQYVADFCQADGAHFNTDSAQTACNAKTDQW